MQLVKKYLYQFFNLLLILGLIGVLHLSEYYSKNPVNQYKSNDCATEKQSKTERDFYFNFFNYKNVAIVPQQISSLISYFGKVSFGNSSSLLHSSTAKYQPNLYIYFIIFHTKTFTPNVLSFIDFNNFRS